MRHSNSSSKKLFDRASSVIPGGVNGTIKYDNPFPLYLRRAEGSRVWDVDGNEYIDYLMSYGALVLGHGSPIVKDAMARALNGSGTTSFGLASEPEVRLAELVLPLYNRRGKIRFTNSGLEATLLAVRIAMAHTGRQKVAKFEGHYHGANPFLLANYKPKRPRLDTGAIEKQPDSAEVSGSLLEGSVVLPFNDVEGVKRVLEQEGEGLAAIFLEPFEDGYIPADPAFLSFLSKAAKDCGAILVYDEVKTGFRVRLGGGAEYYSQKPDLVCLGKILGGGLPVGAVIGGDEIMEMLNPGARASKVFHSGTFNGNPLAMEAGFATISRLKEGGFSELSSVASKLKRAISQALSSEGIAHQMYGEGGVVNYTIGEEVARSLGDLGDLSTRKKIDAEMFANGVYCTPASRFSPSLAHTESDIEETGNKIKAALGRIVTERTISV